MINRPKLLNFSTDIDQMSLEELRKEAKMARLEFSFMLEHAEMYKRHSNAMIKRVNDIYLEYSAALGDKYRSEAVVEILQEALDRIDPFAVPAYIKENSIERNAIKQAGQVLKDLLREDIKPTLEDTDDSLFGLWAAEAIHCYRHTVINCAKIKADEALAKAKIG